MKFEEVKKYIDRVKKTKKFEKLDNFTRMTRIKKEQDLYENIKYYLSIYHSRTDCKEFFQPDFEYFINFLEQYFNNGNAEIFLKDGYIDLSRTLHLVQPPIFSGNKGNFFDKYIIFTDGNIYISKLPLNYRGNSRISNKYCIYTPLIASYIAKGLNVETAEISLAYSAHNGNRILSKNLLQHNEEIVTFTENKDKISEYLNELEKNLKLRKFSQNEIDNIKLDYLKQEFVSKLIGLKDQTADNSPLIVSTDKDAKRHARMAPMFDFDYSFHIGEELKDMLTRKCDNGKTDISSFIEQYKDYPGFKEFLTGDNIKTFEISNVFNQIYENTGIEKFKEYSDDEQMKKFIDFVNENIKKARETILKVYKDERENRE